MLESEAARLPGASLAETEKQEENQGNGDEPESKTHGQERAQIASGLRPQTTDW